ncbi:MAG TPA: ATP-binding protein [Bryobacteraceae bacterium]|nr:ATP-binding protein [Bryobacteraceae bacterium]
MADGWRAPLPIPCKLLVWGAIPVAVQIGLAIGFGPTAHGALLSEALQAVVSALSAALCWRAAGRASGVSRLFWQLVGLAIASQAAGDLWWGYLEGWRHEWPMAMTMGQYLPFVRTLFLTLALFLDLEENSSSPDFGTAVDLVQVAIVFFLVYLLIGYIPQHSPDHPATLLGVLWAVLPPRVVLIALAVVQTYRARQPRVRALYRGLTVYLLWFLIGEGSAAYYLLTRRISSGSFFDLAWIVPAVAIGLWAGCFQRGGADAASAEVGPKTLSNRLLTNATFALAPLIVLLQVAQLHEEFRLLRYALLAASILCFAARLGLSEYRQFRSLESLRQHKLSIESAKEDLLVQKAFLEQLIESAPEAIAIVDPNMVVQRINREFTRLFGYAPEEIYGKPLDAFIVPEGKETESVALNQEAGRGKVASIDTNRKSKDGCLVDVSVLVSPVILREDRRAMFCIYRDISEKKRVEIQLLQSQKLEAVGRLAGGVAHDFNNLLTVINGYGDLLLRRLTSGDPIRHQVEQVRRAGEKAAQLTQQLLAFSRKQIIQPKPVDLNSLVRDCWEMLSRLIGEDIKLNVALAPSLGQIMADSGQIHQVLMNLLVNARDAMPDGGRVTIETANVEIKGTERREVPAGSYVLLAVTDSGVGMDDEMRQHIFEPFYTTKPLGEGTGLGLSMVYGIVKQGGGWIWVYSEPGQGTTFRIYWPRTDATAAPGDISQHAPAELNGNETLLLLEDEEDVRELATELLGSLGYSILKAANGDDALQISTSYPEEIHVLVTDVVLPGMNGRQVAERLKAQRPQLKVLYTSGYTQAAIAHRGVLEQGVAFIPKPYTPDDLAAKVREVLAADDHLQ